MNVRVHTASLKKRRIERWVSKRLRTQTNVELSWQSLPSLHARHYSTDLGPGGEGGTGAESRGDRELVRERSRQRRDQAQPSLFVTVCLSNSSDDEYAAAIPLAGVSGSHAPLLANECPAATVDPIGDGNSLVAAAKSSDGVAPEWELHHFVYFDAPNGVANLVRVNDLIARMRRWAGPSGLAIRTEPQPGTGIHDGGTTERVAQSELPTDARGVFDAADAGDAADAAPTVLKVIAAKSARVHRQPSESLQLQRQFIDALKRRSLYVQYQPQYDLNSGRGRGVEALARWQLPNGQNIAPSVFIPLAERIGLIRTLGAFVLESACEAAAPWCRQSAEPLNLAVNVSVLEIDERFIATLEQVLDESGFPAEQLELEITESALIINPEVTIEHLWAWKKLGVRIAVDDFGTGYSSLNYLTRLPVDRLKLDQSLVRMLTSSSKSVVVMRSLIALAADLNIDVIAEGVETEQELQILTDLGCPQVQGYLLARPMSAMQAQLALSRAWGNRPRTTAPLLGMVQGVAHAH